MRADSSPLRMLLVTLAGWVNRHQQRVIEYLVEENRVLKEQGTGRRLRLTDDQRRRLAASALAHDRPPFACGSGLPPQGGTTHVYALDGYAGANENFVLAVLRPHAAFSPSATTSRSRASVTAR